MAILNALFNSNISTVEEALHAKDTTSDQMKENIKECFELFFNGNTDTEDNCQRIPCLIINKLVKTMFCEYNAMTTKEELESLIESLNEVKKTTMQYTFLGGECLLKPVIKKDGFEFIPIRRDCFIPLGRDVDGTITDLGLTEVTIMSGSYYTLLERRTAGEELTIETHLYCSDNKSTLGRRVPIETLPKYAGIPELITLPIKGLGLVQLKTPIQNCVDLSCDGVCIYAPAIGLIKNINKNEQQLNDEFDVGQSRILVSKDLLRSKDNGTLELYDKVFIALPEDPENVGIHIFNPNLREQSYISRRNEYLKSIESLIGFRRGLLSNVEAVEKTATEITSTAGEYNLTILDIQDVWTKAVGDMVELCIRLSEIYRNMRLGGCTREDIIISWGDGVLYNRASVFNEMLEMVRAGTLKPEILVAWYFDLPMNTPDDIQRVIQKYIPEEETDDDGTDQQPNGEV